MHSDLKPLLHSLHIPTDADPAEIEVLLAIDEERSRTMLKLPRRRHIGLERLQKIELVRELLEARRTNSVTRTPNSQIKPVAPLPKLEQSTETVTDAGALGDIRRLLNLWASNTPLTNFGSEIELQSVAKHKLYHIELQQLYEKRQLLEQSLPNITLASESADSVTDPWSLTVPAPEDFTSSRSLYELPNTRQRVACERCAGQGAHWCDLCKATGVIACASCDGSRRVECRQCPAQGECSACQNSGVLTCLDCKDGWQQCSQCTGYRKLTCEVCLGAGELLKSKVLEVVREAVQAREPFTEEPKLPSEPYQAELCYEAQVTPQELALGDHPAAAMLESLSRRLNRRAHGREVLRSIRVYRSELIRVDYTYEARAYTLWIYGNRVYASTSPIHEWDQRISEAASKALQEGDYRKTLELLSKAFSHSPNSARGLVVLSQTLEALSRELNHHRYSLVIEIADRACLLLGANLAIGFPALRRQAVSRIRSELLLIFVAKSTLSFGFIFYMLHHQGEVYARDSFTFIAPTLCLIALVGMLLAGSRLQTRLARVTASIVVLIAVFTAATVSSLALQQEYVARYRQEGLFKYGDGSYEAAQAAVEPFERATRAQTQDGELYYLLGRAARRSDQFEKAVAALERACQLEPTARNWSELGLALQGQGNTARAVEALARAVALSESEEFIDLLAKALGMEYYHGGKIVIEGREVEVGSFLADREETVERLIAEHAPSDVRALLSIRGIKGLTPLTKEQNAYIKSVTGKPAASFTCSLSLDAIRSFSKP